MPLPRSARTRVAWLIASLAGTGRFPVSPGSAGSAVAILVGWPILMQSHLLLALGAVLATVAGWWATRAADAGDDPGWVVIDEVAGQWIGMLGLPATTGVAGLLLAFLLFRLLDITKLGPVGWADRRHGAAGVMLDDVIAGAAAALLIAAIRLAWPELVL